MTSVIGSFYTISACIDKIPDMTIEEWKAVNNKQDMFLRIYRNTKGAKIPEIESMVSTGNVNPVNKFLSDKGFDIKLNPLEDPRDLAIASILDLHLEWNKEGKETTIFYIREPVVGGFDKYKGVGLYDNVVILKSTRFTNAIAKISTKNKDIVYMVMLDCVPKDNFEVFDLATDLMNDSTLKVDFKYKMVVKFPEVHLDVKPDITWLKGMTDTLEVKWKIDQTLMQTKLDIDKKGVKIKEAVALGVLCLSACFSNEPEPLIISKPFLFVVVREGLSVPLFSAYIDIDGWIKDA
jgi:hypothetical protein